MWITPFHFSYVININVLYAYMYISKMKMYETLADSEGWFRTLRGIPKKVLLKKSVGFRILMHSYAH